MSGTKAKFDVGELIHHRLFGYRGVIVDVDPDFQGTEDWYEQMARSRPPKDQPWYHVLVHDAENATYVAERNLESDETGTPINHRFAEEIFEEFRDGRYVVRRRVN